MSENKKTNQAAKPVSVAMTELQRTILGAIEASGLPPVLVEPVLKTVYQAWAQAAGEQTAREWNQWTAAAREKETEETPPDA